MIYVYPADCTDFSNNGLGAVSPTSCTVTETLNGEWEVTLVHPIDERGKWQKLTDGSILRVPVPAAMTPQINLVTQQYQTTTYDVEVYKVSTSRDPLRLRSGTGTKYKILGKYKKGTEVIVIEKTSSSWYEVTCPDGKHGYMSSEYLTYVRTEQQSTTTNVGFRNEVVEARQLRDQPFRIYRVVPELDKVTVYARHIFYDLLDNMIKQIKPASDAVGASVVKSISDGCLSEHGAYGGKWNTARIRDLVSNEKYTGNALLQKVYVNNHIEKKRIRNSGELPQYYATDTHPAIIDQATFDAAQEALARIASSHAPRKPIKHYAFTGMILCPNCGRHFKRVQNHGLSRWACSTFINEGKEYCHSRKIPEEVLMRVTADLFGWNAFDEIMFRDTVDSITAVEPNQLIFHMKDGTERKAEWQLESRSKSWTPEMKAKAAADARRREYGKKRH